MGYTFLFKFKVNGCEYEREYCGYSRESNESHARGKCWAEVLLRYPNAIYLGCVTK